MNYDTARQQMISQQLRTWDVLDERVLDVLGRTPREAFVPEADRDLAFADAEVPLPHGQCMMAPKVEARLLQELAIASGDQALEVGTGSGYLTACLARLAANVLSLEIFADLGEAAAARLGQNRIDNVEIRDEDATTARIEERFDVIAVTASVPELGERFIELLKPGGRLFIVVGRAPVMEATLVTRHSDGSWTEKGLFETMLTPMINAGKPEAFVL
jgi:protein-L-isoaspartate(D-aspartate) O-methyltransferase